MSFDRFASLFFRFWLAFALAVTAMTVAAAWGVSRVHFNDNLADFFKADNVDYQTLRRFFDDFGADDTSCLVVLSSDDWFRAENAELLRRLTAAAADVPGVSSVYSILDVRRRVPGLGRIQRPLVPRGDATANSFGIARETALKHPLVKGQLLSDDGKTTLVMIKLAGQDLAVGEVEPTVDALQDALSGVVRGRDIQLGMTGIPKLRVDIYYAIQRDQLIFLSIGAFLAIAIAVVMFRRVAAVVIVCVGPALGTLWTLGAMGIAGEPINTFNSILPALVMVIGFTDSVHFMVEIRRLQSDGHSPQSAAENALRHLLLPCGLTSLTTAVGFGSLMIAEMDVIQRFGAACAVGAVLNFIAVVTSVPMLAGGRLGHYVTSGKGTSMEAHTYRLLSKLVGWITQHARTIAVSGCGLTAACVLIALQLEPENRIEESMPANSESYEMLVKCEEEFGGGMSTYVVVEWPEQFDLQSREVLQAIADVHAVLADEPTLGPPFSILNVLAALPHRRGRLWEAEPYLSRMPPDMRDTFVRPQLRKAAIRVQTPDSGCRAMRPIFDRIEQHIDNLAREKHPGFEMHLTGSPVTAVRNINLVIVDLCKSLALASVIIFGVMTLVFRSIRRGLISLLPNVFPLAATAAMLVVVRDSALEISSVVTFSICLGIAVDDTIHFISRFDRELKEGNDVRKAVQQSVAKVGAALLVTTLTLIGGFGAGVFSQLPALRVFSVLSCVALAAAFLADVLILPALLVWFGKSRRERNANWPSASSD